MLTPSTFIETTVETCGVRLPALWGEPAAHFASPTGVVVFAHGSGSGRLSARNHKVARRLHERGFATVLFDLLTEEEGADRHKVFDIPLLAERLVGAVRWCWRDARAARLPVGVFGASTGAGAALVAAARERTIHAVVSRGGRVDLAGDEIDRVRAPTLLIVGERDDQVLRWNQEAFKRLHAGAGPGRARLEIVPGATHLFEEPGALERVGDLAAGWFERTLAEEAHCVP
ncbi:MAG: alpha/beta family hydrolase [Phycisphaerales bacterium]